jgi:3D (Asp-Asp-Asp) domain-containing protein
MLGLTALVWYRYLPDKEYKGKTISNEQEKLTVSQLEPLSLIVVDTKVRVSCYVDTGTMAGSKQTYKGAVAVSDRSIPMGTKIYLQDFGEMTVEDKTAKWVHTKFYLPTIDVWMTEKECKEFGLKELSYVIVK